MAVLPSVEWVTSLAGQRGSEWCSLTTIYLTSDVTASGEYGVAVSARIMQYDVHPEDSKSELLGTLHLTMIFTYDYVSRGELHYYQLDHGGRTL